MMRKVIVGEIVNIFLLKIFSLSYCLIPEVAFLPTHTTFSGSSLSNTVEYYSLSLIRILVTVFKL